MKTERQAEAVLTTKEVKTILGICSPEGVLVGGQALAFWADHLNVSRPPELDAAVTADADFLGDSALTRKLAAKLGWDEWIPALDDATPQTGKVTRKLKDGSVKQVDFLSGVMGLTTKDVVRRAIGMEVPEIGVLRVMHPIDVLDSRIQNLLLIPEKRNAAGIAQAHLAISVAGAFIRREIEVRGERAAIKLLERVASIAADVGAVRVFLLYGIDPLIAVPLGDFRTTTALHSKRWPQITAWVSAERDKAHRLLETRKKRPARK